MYSESAKSQLEQLRRGVVDIIPSEDALLDKLERSIKERRPLRVKLGIDPTSTELHLGHIVPLRKLMQFQELGHHAILIIGTFTALIGDPEGRKSTRPHISRQEVLENAKECQFQIERLIGSSKIEIVYNGDWLDQLSAIDFMKITERITLQQLLTRKDFASRIKTDSPLHIHELMYPTVMGYDSVHLHADVELGATEQVLNIYMGRELQEQHDQEPQVGIILPILVGLDGTEKMSKSLGNYIGIQETPKRMFDKVSSIPDSQITLYYTLLTSKSTSEISKIEEELRTGLVSPEVTKRNLAIEIVGIFHGREIAERINIDNFE